MDRTDRSDRALSLVRPRVAPRAAPPARRMAARMGGRAGGLAARRSAVGAGPPRTRIVRRRVLDPAARRRRSADRSTICATAGGSCASTPALPSPPSASWRSAWPASVTAFSVVSQILLRPLPYPDPDRIVTLWERQPSTPGRLDVAPGNFLDWRARATQFLDARRGRAVQLRLHRRRSARSVARAQCDRRVLRRPSASSRWPGASSGPRNTRRAITRSSC